MSDTSNIQPFIKVDQITQQFGTQKVLNGVSFEVFPGELVALIGGSGAGKSVILKHLDGLLDPLTGHIYIDGQEISNIPEKKKYPMRKKLGFMFQQGALFDSMTVFENVAFPLGEAGITDEKELEKRVMDALASVGLQGSEDKMPANISGGMIKRVAVARAIVSDPQCLLYDEPTAGLDPIVSDSVSYLIRNICINQGITTLIVTHDMSSVIHIADRIIYLKEGTIHWQGTPRDMIDSPDPMIQDFLHGVSGEDWSKLNNPKLNPDFQQNIIQDAINDRFSTQTSQPL